MRRLLAVALLGAAALVFVSTSRGAGGAEDGGGGYRVRAIFDSAASAANDEDVKVAGARIGSIESLEVTPDRKAAITLRVDDKAFTPFHADAHCALRPEGVLAVKFVDCDPGTASAPKLERVRSGDGKGAFLLPVERTSSPVDFDLVTNIMRKPVGQKLAILLSELGTGVAGRGSDLNAVIHRANPALGQTDRVVRLLAAQSDRLARFAVDADRVLAPLARDRKAISGFIVNAGRTAQASADRDSDVARSIQRFPGFLRSLRAQMADLRSLTDQGVPLLADLRRSAPGLSAATQSLGPLARAGTPAVRSLGRLADRAGPDLQRALPLIGDLRRLGARARPVFTGLAALTTHFDREAGIKHIAEILYFGTNAVNGFDSVGHYARAEPLSGACSEYTGKGFFGCDAQWGVADDAAKPISLGGSTQAQATAPAQARAADASAVSSEQPILDYLFGDAAP